MQACVDWVLTILGTQVIKKKRPVRPVFPEYLSVSYDYDLSPVIVSSIKWTVPGHFLTPNFTPKNLTHDNKIFFFFFQFFFYTHA